MIKKTAAKQAALHKRPAGHGQTESGETVPAKQKRPAIPQFTDKTEKVSAVQYKGGVPTDCILEPVVYTKWEDDVICTLLPMEYR